MNRLRAFAVNYVQAVSDFTPNAKRYLLGNFLMSASASIVGVIFNLYLSAAGYNEGFIGSTLSMSGLALGVFALPAGMLSDRWGRKPAMIAGAAAASALMLARAVTIDRAALVGASFLGGIAATVYALSTAPFMMENSPEQERTHLFSMSFAVMLAAGVLGSLAGGKLPDLIGLISGVTDRFLLYRLTLVFAGALSFSSVLPLLGIRETQRRQTGLVPKLFPGDRGDWLLMGKFAWCNLWVGLGAGLVIPFFNLYFATRFRATSGQIGFYFSVSQVFTFLAVLAAPAIARRIGKVRTVVLMELLSLPFLVSLGVENTLTVAVLAFWARASLMQMSSPIGSAFTMEVIPRRLRATANSLTAMSWNLSWAGSTAASGFIMQRYGYSVPYYLTAACYAVSAISYYLFFRGTERTTRPAV